MSALLFEHEYPEATQTLIDVYVDSAIGIRNAFSLAYRGKLYIPSPLPIRNDPCPCGSGVKSKRCCGNPKKVKDWAAWSCRITQWRGNTINVIISNRHIPYGS